MWDTASETHTELCKQPSFLLYYGHVVVLILLHPLPQRLLVDSFQGRRRVATEWDRKTLSVSLLFHFDMYIRLADNNANGQSPFGPLTLSIYIRIYFLGNPTTFSGNERLNYWPCSSISLVQSRRRKDKGQTDRL